MEALVELIGRRKARQAGGAMSITLLRIGFFLSLLISSVAACSNERVYVWTEDVEVSDGLKIVVTRRDTYRLVTDVGSGLRTGLLLKRASIGGAIPAPINSQVVWEGSLQPLALRLSSDQQLYLVCAASTSLALDEWKIRGRQIHVSFVWTPGGWRRIPLAELPSSVQPNLLVSVDALFGDQHAQSGDHVDLAKKNKIDCDPRIDRRFKRIN